MPFLALATTDRCLDGAVVNSSRLPGRRKFYETPFTRPRGYLLPNFRIADNPGFNFRLTSLGHHNVRLALRTY
jgi:hypothetical protein